jgi:hypothetical protein
MARRVDTVRAHPHLIEAVHFGVLSHQRTIHHAAHTLAIYMCGLQRVVVAAPRKKQRHVAEFPQIVCWVGEYPMCLRFSPTIAQIAYVSSREGREEARSRMAVTVLTG